MTRPTPLCVDFETHPVKPGGAAPKPVCAGWATRDVGGNLVSGLLLATDACKLIHRALVDGQPIVNHHLPFDLAVYLTERPEDLSLVYRRHEEGLLPCTMIREQVFALAKGETKFGSAHWSYVDDEEDEDGEEEDDDDDDEGGGAVKTTFFLEACVRKHFGHQMTKDPAIQTGYWRLDGKPLSRYTDAERRYPVEDAEWALRLHEHQVEVALREGLPGDGWELPNEREQQKKAWALHLMSVWGLRTNAETVSRVEVELAAEFERLQRALVEGVKDAPADVARQLGVKPGSTVEPGLIRPPQWSKREPRRILKGPTADAKVVCARVEAAYAALAERAAAVGEQGPVLPYTKGTKDRERPGEYLEGTQRPSTKRRILVASQDPTLQVYARRGKTSKNLKTYVPILRQGATVPINPRVNAVLETGRVSISRPGVQTLPRKGLIRLAFEARAGWLYVSCDYDQAELRSHAQVCLDLFGHSALADEMNRGEDPHLNQAAAVMGITKEEAIRRYQAGDKEIEDNRQVMKCFHPDTEVLTRGGWLKIEKLRVGEEVVQAHPREDGVELEWAVPTQVFSRPHDGKLAHLSNKSVDIRVTTDHRMLAWGSGNRAGTKRNVKVVMPADFPRQRQWASAGLMKEGDTVDERLLRLAVAVQADGSYVGGGHWPIRLGFTKRRKVDRLRALLESGWEQFSLEKGRHDRTGSPPMWKELPGKVHVFELNEALSSQVKELLNEDKSLPWWWLSLSAACRLAVLDEARFWDGTQTGKRTGYSYSSAKEKNVDVLQAIGVLTGSKSRKGKQLAEGGKRPNDHYTLSLKDHWHTRGENVEYRESSYRGEVVCLSVPSSFVLVRDKGLPLVCGQCPNFGLPGGMGAVKLVEYAADQEVFFTIERAKDLKEAWLARLPEMREYFAYVSDLCGESGHATVEQIRSGRIRGKARYTAICNGLFQSLTADAKAAALWQVSKECYVGEWECLACEVERAGYPEIARPTLDEVPHSCREVARGERSPLFGSRPVLDMHDEIFLETPNVSRKARTAAAKRLSAVMIACAKRYLPDLKVKARSVLMKNWHKGAKPLERGGILYPVTVNPTPEPPKGTPEREAWQPWVVDERADREGLNAAEVEGRMVA